MRTPSTSPSFQMERNIVTQRIAVGLTLLAALFATACGEDAKPQPTQATVVFRTQPASVRAGERLGTVEVAVVDASGNVLQDRGATVQLSLVGAPAGTALGGSTRATLAYGVARFTDLTVARAAAGMKLEVRLAEQTAQSEAFTVRPAAPARLALTSGPTDVDAGGVLPPLRVGVQDAFGNLTDENVEVTAALEGGTTGAILEGTRAARTAAGVATFSELSVDKDGDGYVLAFSSGTLPVARSAPFNVRPGVPVSLSISTQPAESTVAGATLAPVRVTLLDRKGNVARRAEGSVTVALVAANGATLEGSATAQVDRGVATFDALSIQRAGTGYQLRASFGTLEAVDSSAFAITPAAAARLAYVTAPGAAVAGVALTPAVQVEVLDTYGNRTASTATVSVALQANPGNAALNGARSVAAVAGVATFSTLSINVAAQGYTLEATSGALQAVSSGTFDVAPAAAAALAFTVQPSNAVAGEALSPAVEVTVRDAFGNTVPVTDTVTLALEGGTLHGTFSVQAVAGVARFSDVNVRQVGTGYQLGATSGALTVAVSGTFAITPAAPAQLVFSRQPANGTAGVALSPSVRVSILDAFGNLTGSTASVTVALDANPAGGTLLGTLTEAASAGVASFDAVRLERAGSGYSLRASSGSLTAAVSSTFDITAAAAATVAFRSQPANGVAGTALPAFEVELLDAFGNLSASTASVTLALDANPGNGALSGTVQEDAAAGVARFSAVRLDRASAGYTLRASSTGLTPAVSTPFDIAPSAPASLAYLQQPTAIVAGEPVDPAVRVAVDDAFGNRATNASGLVTLVMGNNPGGATLSGTVQASLSNGVASFGDLSLDRAGTGYTLSASFGSVPAVESSAFDVAPATAALLFVSAPSGNVTAGAAFVAEVEFRDEFGNRTPSRSTVSLRLSDNADGATLAGVAVRSAVAGLARFTGLSVERAGTGYTLEASSGSLPVVLSAAFNVTPATATSVAMVVQPPETVVAGEPMAAFSVEMRDRFNNRVPNFGAAGEFVQAGVDPARHPNGATLGGAARLRAPVNGVTTWTGMTLDKAGPTELYFIAMNNAGTTLFTGYSRSITVTPAAAAGIAFRQVPAQGQAGSALGPAVQVQATDRFGNATSGGGDVTLSLGANPGGDMLRGTLTAALTDGVATFADLVLEKAGVGYTLKASMPGVPVATSPAFTIVGAEAVRLAFVSQPRSTPNGLPLNEVAVGLVDAFGNRAASTADITVALGNASGAVLGGTVTVAAQNGVARFGDLSVDRNGQDYTLAASSGALQGVESQSFDVYGASLAYTDPVGGRIRLMRNPASTSTRLVLDVVAVEDLTGYGAGFNLPLDATKVRLAAQGAITPGAILSAGSSVPALAAALPDSGPLAGVLTSGISQKAAGSGAVAADTAIAAGSVLYQVSLELRPGAEPGVVFDGASLGSRFKGLLRNKLGDDVVGSNGFGVGRLEITGG
jgi:hypothetical protein